MRTWVRRWAPAILVMIVIFFLSSLPASKLPTWGKWDTPAKKAAHMIGYALLTAGFLNALRHNHNTDTLRSVFAICLTVLYAALDEWHQSFVPGRTASIWDVAIDSVGGIIGLLSWTWVRKKSLDLVRNDRIDRSQRKCSPV